MSLQEDINICDDRFYDDAKWARHCTPDSPPNSEEYVAATRINAWERVCTAARAGENFGASDHLLVENGDLKQENYRMKGACDGYATAVANYRQALQEAGVEIAKLKMELMVRG